MGQFGHDLVPPVLFELRDRIALNSITPDPSVSIRLAHPVDLVAHQEVDRAVRDVEILERSRKVWRRSWKWRSWMSDPRICFLENYLISYTPHISCVDWQSTKHFVRHHLKGSALTT